MKFIFCAIVFLTAAGCSTAGPFITRIGKGADGELILHQCNMRTTFIFLTTKLVNCEDVKAENWN